jgi:NADH:ubiquinone oxidoreductase subunit 3 (subunit A)
MCFSDILGIYAYCGISGLLIVAILFVVFTIGARVTDLETLSAYECGFNPFEDAKYKFDVQFYLVSILYIIFDLEVMLLYPLVSCFFFCFSGSFLMLSYFFLLLMIGILYEMFGDALYW